MLLLLLVFDRNTLMGEYSFIGKIASRHFKNALFRLVLESFQRLELAAPFVWPTLALRNWEWILNYK